MLDRRTARQADGRTDIAPQRAFARKLIDAIRRMAGMPDYHAYLAHVRRYHPHAQPVTERQFYHDFVQARYGDGPTRCC